MKTKKYAFILIAPFILAGCMAESYEPVDCTEESVIKTEKSFTTVQEHNKLFPADTPCQVVVYDNAVVGDYVIHYEGERIPIQNRWVIDSDGVHVWGILGTHMPVIFEQLQTKNPPVKTLVLEDIEGSADDDTVMPTIQTIYDTGYSTHLTANSHVTSGGTDLFTGGVKRTAVKGAKVGVHSWDWDEDVPAMALPKNHPEHQKYLSLYNHVGVPSDFYWYTLKSAPADGMHYMSWDDIVTYLLNPKP